MLERLDGIPWERLRCQVGYAGHVPGAVRGLLSNEPAEVEAAYWRLENRVVVQGTLYEAAEYLPAILLEALDLARHKGSLLELLFQIGNGESADDPGMGARCRQAVVSGLERWLAGSPDADPRVRAAAEEDLRHLRVNEMDAEPGAAAHRGGK